MIKINLVREGRAVRGAGAAPALPTAVAVGAPATTNVNNILILALLALGVLAAGGYWFWEKRILAERKDVADQRRVEAQKLERIIHEVEDYQKRKDNLQQRIDLINQLKQNQKGPVRILDQVSRDLPDLVWLDSMDISGGRIALNGRGLNPNAIALFIENIKNDPYFEEPQVNSINRVSEAPLVYTYDMNFAFTWAPKTPPAAPAGTPAATGTTGTTTTATGTQPH
ncbi:MAG: PilN domain-containing protein [Acidobacteria bacterium]|nr:PilN domain-containing protein [Acidobacteriota bacterium]MBV9477790.1 PilN domain-containing protein [Acidobacteriota bacterium]